MNYHKRLFLFPETRVMY